MELLFSKQIVKPSIMHSVDGFKAFHKFSADLTASIPFALSIEGKILTMSNDTSIAFSERPVSLMSSIISSKCDVFFIRLGIFSVMGAHTTSKNLDKFSIAVLHPVFNKRTGFPSLCVLYKVIFFPGCAFLFTMNSFHSFVISPCFIHFSDHASTFSICFCVGS